VSGQPWKVVLAAGAGRRLQGVTGGVPKQFWRSGGRATLLEQTIDRFDPIAPPSRTVVIVDESQREHIAEGARLHPARTLVVQPQDRGTAAGVLLALTPVLGTRPEAIVILTPSDHGVVDVPGFRERVAQAVQRVRNRDDIVLFGAVPAAAQPDYGWISLRHDGSGGAFRPVASFVEKPDGAAAARLFRDGAIWNTMVVVARARTLHDLYATLLPGLTALISAVIGLPEALRASYLAAIYRRLPQHDFSRDVLGRAHGLIACVLPRSIGWTDLGTPDRLAAWQRNSGRTQRSAAAFSAA